MGLFGFGRKKDIIDFGEILKRKEEAKETSSTESTQDTQSDASGFTFLDTPKTSENEETVDLSSTHPERKKRLAKRFMEMTNKLEDISNQIYHLQQRIELLERKLDVNKS